MAGYKDKYKLKTDNESIHSPDNLNTLSSAFEDFTAVNQRITTDLNKEKKYYEKEKASLKKEIRKAGSDYYAWKIDKIYEDSVPEQKTLRIQKVVSKRKIFFEHLGRQIGMERGSDSVLKNLNIDDNDTKEYLTYFRDTAIGEKESMENFIKSKNIDLETKIENKKEPKEDYEEEESENETEYRERMKEEAKSRNFRLATLDEERENGEEEGVWQKFAKKSGLDNETPNLVNRNVINSLMEVSNKLKKDSGILGNLQKDTVEEKFQSNIKEILSFFPVFEINFRNMATIYNKIKNEEESDIQADDFEKINKIRELCSEFSDESKEEDDEASDREEYDEDGIQDRIKEIQKSRLKNCLYYHEDSMEMYLNRIIYVTEQIYDQYYAIGNDLKQNTKNLPLEDESETNDTDNSDIDQNDLAEDDEENVFKRVANKLTQKAIITKDKLVQKAIATKNKLFTAFESVRNKDENENDESTSGYNENENKIPEPKQGFSEKLEDKITSVNFFINRFKNTLNSNAYQQTRTFLAKLMKTANTQLKETEEQIANRGQPIEKDDDISNETEQKPEITETKIEKTERLKQDYKNNRAKLILIYEYFEDIKNSKDLLLNVEKEKILKIQKNILIELSECKKDSSFVNFNFSELDYKIGINIDKIDEFIEDMPEIVKDLKNLVEKFQVELLNNLKEFKKISNRFKMPTEDITNVTNDIYFGSVIDNFNSDFEDLDNNKEIAKRNNKDLNEFRSEIYFEKIIEKNHNEKIEIKVVKSNLQRSREKAEENRKQQSTRQFNSNSLKTTQESIPKEYISEIATNKKARLEAKEKKNAEIEKLKNNFKNLYRPKLFLVYDFADNYLSELNRTMPNSAAQADSAPRVLNTQINSSTQILTTETSLNKSTGNPNSFNTETVINPIQAMNNSTKFKLEQLKSEISKAFKFGKIYGKNLAIGISKPSERIYKTVKIFEEIKDSNPINEKLQFTEKNQNASNNESQQQIVNKLQIEDTRMKNWVEKKIQNLKNILESNKILLYQFSSDIEDVSKNLKFRTRDGGSLKYLFEIKEYEEIPKKI
ncbi:MAG: hypothetical protein LBJ32_00895 [Oscillospiraceae bacterium]|jgi:hypothetical protein|nr:hypothetical protein [Oscillospiraceae bacterium]